MEILIYFLTITTGIGVVVSAKNLLHAISSRNWIETDAKVFESYLEDKSDIDDTENLKQFLPIIKFRYYISGTKYENENFNYCKKHLDRRDSFKIMQEYPVGKYIKVYVNPKKHNQSVIVRGVHFWHFFSLLACLFFFGAFIYSLFESYIDHFIALIL